VRSPSFLTNNALSLICFGGKGGVGKTTSAAASALYIAENNPNKRILLASIDPAHSLLDCLGGTDIFENLNVWEIDAEDSFKRFMEKYQDTLKKILDIGTFLDKTDISELLSLSLPGLDEMMAMLELVDLIETKVYDVIILDTAPTGHTLKFLQMPRMLRQWIRFMDLLLEKHRYLSKLYRRYHKLEETDAFINTLFMGAKKTERLMQHGSCEFVPVLTPNAMSVMETRRFLTILDTYNIPVNNLIVNSVSSSGTCTFCSKQFLFHKRFLQELKRNFKEYQIITVPVCKDEILGSASLQQFAQMMIFSDSNGNNEYHENISCNLKDFSGSLPQKECFEEKNSLFIPKDGIEFLIFGGKGGVGKTTVAASAALTLSDMYPEKNFLLFSTDPAHSLSDCLDMDIKGNGLKVRTNLHVMEIDAENEYQKLKQLYRKDLEGVLYRIINRKGGISLAFEKDVLESLIDVTPPGIDEAMALVRIVNFAKKHKYDTVILDTSPTGHLIRFLEMPELALVWLKFFFNIFLKYKNIFRMPKISAFFVELSKNIKSLLLLLRDDDKSLFIPVAIPTKMAYEETKGLAKAMRRLKIPVSQAVLNMVHPSLCEDNSGNNCPVCINRLKYDSEMCRMFKKLFPEKPLCVVDNEEKDVIGINALEDFGKKLYGQVVTQ